MKFLWNQQQYNEMLKIRRCRKKLTVKSGGTGKNSMLGERKWRIKNKQKFEHQSTKSTTRNEMKTLARTQWLQNAGVRWDKREIICSKPISQFKANVDYNNNNDICIQNLYMFVICMHAHPHSHPCAYIYPFSLLVWPILYVHIFLEHETSLWNRIKIELAT